MSIAGELARFLASTNVTDLPPLALERARMVIASTIASAAMGVDIVSSRIIRELAKERGGAEQATLWFDGGRRLPIAEAARVNAVMSDAAGEARKITAPATSIGSPMRPSGRANSFTTRPRPDTQRSRSTDTQRHGRSDRRRSGSG